MKKEINDILIDFQNYKIDVGEASNKLQDLTKRNDPSYKDLYKMLEKINTIMWEGFMIKDKGFSKADGFKIMTILNEWANNY
jgi:hypothetical protein